MGANIGCLERWWKPAEKHMRQSEYRVLLRLLESRGHDVAYDYAFERVPAKTLIHIDEINGTEPENFPFMSLVEFISLNNLWSKVPVLSIYFGPQANEREYWFYDIELIDLLRGELNFIQEKLLSKYDCEWFDFNELNKKLFNLPEDIDPLERENLGRQTDQFCAIQVMEKHTSLSKDKDMAIFSF